VERPNKEVMFEDLAALIECDYRTRGRRSLSALTVRFRHLRPFFGSFKAAEITPALIEQYCDRRRGESRMVGPTNGKSQKFTSPACINLEMSCLKRMLRLAVDRQMLSSVPVFPAPAEPNHRRQIRFIDRWIFAAIRDAMPADLRDPLAFLYLLARRPTEMHMLQWSHVHFVDRSIEIEFGRSETVRLDDSELRDLMRRAEAARQRDCPFVFHRDGRQLTRSMFKRPWLTATRTARAEGFVIYDLRRSAERELLLSGVDVRTIMSISGRRTASTLARAVVANDLSAAMAKRRAFHEAREMRTGKVVAIGAARRGRQLERTIKSA